MPELPEVQTIASDLDQIVGGRVIKAVQVSYPKIVASDPSRFVDLLTGAKIEKVERFGKWIRFFLNGRSGPVALLVHLKMTGQFDLGSWPGTAGWPPHAHAAFQLDQAVEGHDTLFYRDIRKFGRLRAFDLMELEEFLANLNQGPDPLSVTSNDFFQRLKSRKGRLKCVLLDQTVIAGLGNIYVDESLFAAGLSPYMSASNITPEEAERLLKEARRILKASIKARGSTTSNYQGLKGPGSYQNSHRIYGKTGEPCQICGRLVERCVVGGRSTHHCPDCQPKK